MKPSRGVLYMAASALGFSAMSVLVKVASARLPTGEIVLARAVITLALSYVMLIGARVPRPWGVARGKLVLRGALGFVALSGYYGGIVLLPLADATTLHNMTPMLTALMAWWILGERIGGETMLAVACGIAGVLLIVHEPAAGAAGAAGGGDRSAAHLGVAIALGGAACSAAAYVTVRELRHTEHPLVIVFYFPLVAAPLAIPWAAAAWVTPTPAEILILVGIGVTTQVGQVFLTLGLSAEQAGRASSVNYLQIVFAMLWQLAVFGDPPDATTIAGAALIVAGTLAVARGGRK